MSEALWALGRGTGVVALVMFTITLVLGIVGRSGRSVGGLGTLAVDLLLVVTVVSLLRERLGPRVFRTVHWATYVLWPVALVHAIGTGTDRASEWMLALAAVCTAAVVGAGGWRLTPSFNERGWSRTPRKVSP